jgi:N-acetylmuramoyl-L-alanine amidase
MRPVERRSPNHNSRGAKKVALIVLHADAGRTDAGTLAWLQSSESKVSYHILVGRDGTAYRCVPDDRRAWHAGKANWMGEKDVNGISLGLAFANRHDGIEGLTGAQRATAQAIVAGWQQTYGPIPVTTHAQVAPGRKTDPEQMPGFALADYV